MGWATRQAAAAPRASPVGVSQGAALANLCFGAAKTAAAACIDGKTESANTFPPKGEETAAMVVGMGLQHKKRRVKPALKSM